MSWTFTCECGNEIAGATQDALVAAVRAHIGAAHPMVAPPSVKDVTAIAEPVAAPPPVEGITP